jgi:hypothetical protein
MTTHSRLSSSFVLSTLSMLVLASVASGCNGHPIKPVELGTSAVKSNPVPLDVNKKVDVLLVIDNSGSMGEEQANLAANFGPFIEKLEAAGADYRIGITTTDVGGQGCAAGGTGGKLVLSSCLDRPHTFVFGQTDQYEVACAAHCLHGDEALAVRPTMVGSSGEASPRPWIESYAGISNLPAGMDTLEAFQCFAPQGISGCGWESPLEAMARALDNMQNPARPEYGFLRPDALLAVLIVTDEVDCSVTPEMRDALFVDKTFWSGNLTSAACWNAGVRCSGDSPFDDCWDVNLDANAEETEDPSKMVLRPVSRYVERLEAVAAAKMAGREVLVSVIAGVPEGYSSGAAEIVYANVSETSFEEPADFQALFGIGAGCQTEINGAIQSAVPPVRLKVLAEAFMGSGLAEGARNIYSVCADDYTPAILDIVAGIEVELPPACFSGCVLDVDPSTDELDYSCDVLEATGGKQYSLPECDRGQSGPSLPEGADACWVAKVGADLAPECVSRNSNLEFDLIRRPGVPVASDVEVLAMCELATIASGDCG